MCWNIQEYGDHLRPHTDLIHFQVPMCGKKQRLLITSLPTRHATWSWLHCICTLHKYHQWMRIFIQTRPIKPPKPRVLPSLKPHSSRISPRHESREKKGSKWMVMIRRWPTMWTHLGRTLGFPLEWLSSSLLSSVSVVYSLVATTGTRSDPYLDIFRPIPTLLR